METISLLMADVAYILILSILFNGGIHVHMPSFYIHIATSVFNLY